MSIRKVTADDVLVMIAEDLSEYLPDLMTTETDADIQDWLCDILGCHDIAEGEAAARQQLWARQGQGEVLWGDDDLFDTLLTRLWEMR